MARPSVAVVIPCFNGAPFIETAINSALNQTYRPLQVIVVNDGSIDSSAEIVGRYRSKITAVSQTNRGLAATRNRAIQESTSDLVAFLDHDDVWAPSKLLRQVEALESTPEAGIVHCAARCVDADGNEVQNPSKLIEPPAQGNCRASLLRSNSVIVSSVVVRRDLLRQPAFDPACTGSEDWDLWLYVSRLTRFAYVPERLVDYRVHGSNMSARRALMLEGRIAVYNNAIHDSAVDNDQEAGTLAQRGLARAHKELGHFHYETGDYTKARFHFLRGRKDAGLVEYARLAGASLPSAARALSRRVWRWMR